MPSFFVRTCSRWLATIPTGVTADARISRDERLAVVGLVFVERIRIDDRSEQIARVVWLVAIEAHQIVNRVRIFCAGVALPSSSRAWPASASGNKRDQRAQSFQTGRIVLLVEIDRAADLGVHLRAAEFFVRRRPVRSRL